MQLVLLLLFPSLAFAQLNAYKIDPQGVTISGVSSGAFMSVQMQVAFSKTISGSGSVAGGPYWCAQGDKTKAYVDCMDKPSHIQIPELIAETYRLSNQGLIDPVDALENHKIYIFSSASDKVVNEEASSKLKTYMTEFLPASHITSETHSLAAHGFPTLMNGAPCGMGASPYILKCNLDTAGNILKALYGPLKSRGTAVSANLIQFSQQDFGNAQTPIHEYGWVYVPKECAEGATCKLHVALHGCKQTSDEIQDQFPIMTGYNDWAETNRIIVLYPQSLKVKNLNPLSCWDIFGFTGANYHTKSGPQMAAIKKMIDRLMGL